MPLTGRTAREARLPSARAANDRRPAVAGPDNSRIAAGFLFRPGSLWVGAHWSAANRRLCVNLVPCCTLWLTLAGGVRPGNAAPPAGRPPAGGDVAARAQP